MKADTDVYWNLHKHCFSVKDRNEGKVKDHTNLVALKDVEFIVQPSGRKKVLETGRKNVHAFVRGFFVPAPDFSHNMEVKKVKYNPYEFDSFVSIEDEKPIKEAKYVLCYKTEEGKPVVFAYLRSKDGKD